MNIIAKIVLALKKKHEEVVLDLYLKDYEHSNYYFALVFNKKIDTFKILFVPLDMINDLSKLSEYFCYQFIFLNQVEHILSAMNNNIDLYNNEDFRNRKTDNFDSYYIELNYYNKSKYTFRFSQFIDKDFLFLFDVIAVFFEYLPHIVSELCMKLLQDFDNNNISIKYNYSLDFDLFNDSLDKFENDEHLKIDDIRYLEKIGNKYYAVILDSLVVIEFIRGKRIVNISSKFDKYSYEHSLIIRAIRQEVKKDYSRFRFSDLLYICYGISDGKFKIIGHDDIDICCDKVKVINISEDLKKELDDYLNSSYSKNEVKKIYKNLFEEK